MSKKTSAILGLAALFGALFLLTYGVYGYAIFLASETGNCFFVFTRQFLSKFLDHPGGLLRYAGRFLGQFYYHEALGALAVSACITCFTALFFGLLTKLNREARLASALFPCVLLFALHTSISYAIYHTLGLIVVCAAALAQFSLRTERRRQAYALLAMPILYLLVGSYAWLFAAWALLDAWLGRPWRAGLAFKSGYLALCLALPLVAYRWVFPIPLRSAWASPLSFAGFASFGLSRGHLANTVSCLLAVALAASLLLMPFWRRLPRRVQGFWRLQHSEGKRLLLAVEAVVLVVLLLALRYDRLLDTFVAGRKLYKERQWEDLLAQAKAHRQRDILSQFMTNFALAKTGRLLDEMFHYPQGWGTRGLLLNIPIKPMYGPAEDDSSRAMYNSDVFLELGHINLALRHAYNYLVFYGEHYDAFERMAECAMVNENYDLAAKHLNILEKTLFHRDFARRFKAILRDPKAMAKQWGRYRSLRPVVERRIIKPPPAALANLLESKPDNRLAFDYLTAWLLLDKRSLPGIASDLKSYQKAGHSTIPIHCQEALLILASMNQTRWVVYDKAVAQRVAQFFKDFNLYGRRDDAVERFRSQYGDTYMFYHFFVATPNDARWMWGADRSSRTSRQHN